MFTSFFLLLLHSVLPLHQVKPENILVSCERAVLCDFGVAELLELRTLQRARRVGLRTEEDGLGPVWACGF